MVGTDAERWDGYLDADTGLLRTLSAEPIRTADELREFEDSRVQLRALELKANPIEGDFGFEHLKEIHRRLFQDVYPWAGEVRTVGIKKGESGFLPPEHASFVVDGAARLMREDGMLRPGMADQAWADKLAERFNDVNEAHPFREGNGRTQRLYFDQVAAAGGKMIHWNVLTKEQNAAVSGAARDGQLAPLRDALRIMVTDRMDPLALQRAKQAAEVMRASSATRSGRPQARTAGAGEQAYYGRAGRTNGPGTTGPRRDGYGR
jgi:cell filamentation protein